CCSARSRVTVTTALYWGPRVSRRARNVSASSTGDTCRVCTRVCSSRMGMKTTGLITRLALLAIGYAERERFIAIVEPDGAQRPVQAFRRHRQLPQPDAYGPVDGIR